MIFVQVETFAGALPEDQLIEKIKSARIQNYCSKKRRIDEHIHYWYS